MRSLWLKGLLYSSPLLRRLWDSNVGPPCIYLMSQYIVKSSKAWCQDALLLHPLL